MGEGERAGGDTGGSGSSHSYSAARKAGSSTLSMRVPSAGTRCWNNARDDLGFLLPREGERGPTGSLRPLVGLPAGLGVEEGEGPAGVSGVSAVFSSGSIAGVCAACGRAGLSLSAGVFPLLPSIELAVGAGLPMRAGLPVRAGEPLR